MPLFSALIIICAVKLVVGADSQEKLGSSLVLAKSRRSIMDTVGIGQLKLQTTYMGLYKYDDSDSVLFKNERIPTNFFFTPMPYIETETTRCYYDEFTSQTELIIHVSLYSKYLRESIEKHIKNREQLCHTEYCDISIVPIDSIRFRYYDPQLIMSKNPLRLPSQWQSVGLFQKTIPFTVDTYNMSACETLKESIINSCLLLKFAIQYSLHNQPVTARTVTVTSNDVTKTFIYEQIQSQVLVRGQDTAVLTIDDYRNLLSEVVEQVLIDLRTKEDVESIRDSTRIDNLLSHQLQQRQTQLTADNHHLWETLYWTPELTRPDRFAAMINQVLKRDSLNNDRFIYDYSQIVDIATESLSARDRQKFNTFTQYLKASKQKEMETNTDSANAKVLMGLSEFFARANSTTSFKNQHENSNFDERKNLDENHANLPYSTIQDKQNSSTVTMMQKDAEQLVQYFSTDIEIKNDIVKPKPINVMILKFDQVKRNEALFSTTVEVKIRKNIYQVPLRCSSESEHVPSIPIATEQDDCYLAKPPINEAELTLINTLMDDFGRFQTLIKRIESYLNETVPQAVNRSMCPADEERDTATKQTVIRSFHKDQIGNSF